MKPTHSTRPQRQLVLHLAERPSLLEDLSAEQATEVMRRLTRLLLEAAGALREGEDADEA